MAGTMTVPASSPCIQLCQIDRVSGLCIGCGRTLNEIGNWSRFSEETRRETMKTLPDRMAAAWKDRAKLMRSARRARNAAPLEPQGQAKR
jgi:uncharacterized protein